MVLRREENTSAFRGNSSIEYLIRQLASKAYLESVERTLDRAGVEVWNAGLENDVKIVNRTYCVGKTGLYVISEHWRFFAVWPSVDAGVVPFDCEEPVFTFFDWNASEVVLFTAFEVSFQRLPAARNQMISALSRLSKSAVQVAEELAAHHYLTTQFGYRPSASLKFDNEIADLLAARPHPLIQYGKAENEDHCGMWFTRFANGYLVRDRSMWDVHYVYLDDIGVRFAEGELLEELYQAHPDLWYEPLDADLQPALHAWARRIGEEQDDDAYQQVSLLLEGLRKPSA